METIFAKIFSMKKIGLIGGLTWVSKLDYYWLLNSWSMKEKGVQKLQGSSCTQ